jgi:aromatic-L-amino-acid decarboxylase
MVIRSYGANGLREIVRRHIELAAELESWIAAEPEFEIVAPRSLALINFRFRPEAMPEGEELDRLNGTLLQRINDDGRIYLTQNKVRGRAAIRFSIGQTNTERRHVAEGWDVVTEIARDLHR